MSLGPIINGSVMPISEGSIPHGHKFFDVPVFILFLIHPYTIITILYYTILYYTINYILLY